MSVNRLRLCPVWVLLLLWGSLSGCVISKTPITRFYILTALDSETPLVVLNENQRPLSVEVAALRLPQYLERPQIVTRSSDNRLELAEYDQWGGNLRKNMIRILAENLSRLLATPDIAISPHRPSVSPDFRVEVEVMQFEKTADGQVRLSAQWRLSKGRKGTPLTVRVSHLAHPVVSTEPGYAETVAAMSALFGELSQIIGQAIVKHSRDGSAP